MTQTNRAASADIVIIGGGIVGAAGAESLSRAGLRVTLVERLGLAAGASGACMGSTGYDLFSDEYELKLSIEGLRSYQELADRGVQFDYVRSGTMIMAEPEQELKIRSRVVELRAQGLELEWLDRAALSDAEPAISPNVIGAALIKDAGHLTPMRVVAELVKFAIQKGARIHTGTEVTGIEMTRGKVVAVLTSTGRIATERIVIAAGCWSRPVARLMGLQIPVWPLKGHVLVTEAVPGLVRHFLLGGGYQATVEAMSRLQIGPDGPRAPSPQVATALQPRPHGQILIGSSREFAGFDRDVSRERLAQIAARACRIIPQLKQIRIIRTYAGLRPWTPDGRPLIGITHQVEGVILATGHGGEGNRLALVTARLVTDILFARPASIELSYLSPDRFIGSEFMATCRGPDDPVPGTRPTGR